MTFLEIAEACLARGWHVFPCVPRTKKPLTPHGFRDASNDPAQIQRWADQWPDANAAIACEASGLTVLDADHGITDADSFQSWRNSAGLAETYTIHTGRRPEFGAQSYYSGVMPGCNFELNGVKGEIKSAGGYVMAAGCVHPSGETYEVICAAPLAALPDVVRHLKPPSSVKTTTAQGVRTKWKLPVRDGDGRDDFLTEQAGIARAIGCGEDAILARLVEINSDPLIMADPKPDADLERIARSIAKKPVVGDPVVVIGSADPPLEELPVFEKPPRPVYPIEVWEDTIAGEFAKRCTHDNNIPRKIFVEAFRTELGAVLGDRLSCGLDGVLPRAYTVLIMPFGKGKGSAFRRTANFFKSDWYSATAGASRPALLTGAEDFIWKPTGIGARTAQASSVPGMARLTRENKTAESQPHLCWRDTIPRFLFRYEEMKGLFSTLYIEGGTGTGMEGAICQLWDDTEFFSPATSGRAAQYGQMQLSLLCAVVPDDWTDLASRGNVIGGGLYSRLNLIGTLGEYENVADMQMPDFSGLRESLLDRILALATTPIKTDPTPEARGLVGEWQRTLRPGQERMNIHVWRSALILAWLHQADQITGRIAEQAIRLGEYQICSHDYYAIQAADSAQAKTQQKIVQALTNKGPLAHRALQRAAHAERIGTEQWRKAMAGLIADKRIVHVKATETYYLVKEEVDLG